MSTSKINQAEWDALFERLIAATDEVIARQKFDSPSSQERRSDATPDCGYVPDSVREKATAVMAGSATLRGESIQEPSMDDNLSEQAWEDYEAAIRMSPQLCALCHKEIQRGFARYWRDKLLHQECLIPFISAQRMNPEHRYEEEA